MEKPLKNDKHQEEDHFLMTLMILMMMMMNHQERFKQLNKLSIKDANYQEEIHKLLNYSSKDQKNEAKHIKQKAHFPL